MTSGSPPLSASVAARRPTARRYPRRTCPRRSTRDSRCPPPFPSSRPPCACRCFPCCRKDRAASHPRHSSRESLPQTSHAPLATSALAANRTTSTSNSLARALRLPCFLSSICILLIYCKSEVPPHCLAETALHVAIVMPNPRHPVRQSFFISALWRHVQEVIRPDQNIQTS